MVCHSQSPKQETPLYNDYTDREESENEKRRKDCHSQISSHSPTSSLKTGQSHCYACGGSYNHRQKCWEGCFFTSCFPCSPRPWPNVEQTLIFVHVIVLLYPNIEQGRRGLFSKRENSLLLLSCTTFPTIFVCDCRSRLKKAEYATCTSPIMHLICPAKFCITFVFLFLLGITTVPREIDNDAYAKCLGAKKAHYGTCASGVYMYGLPTTD